MASRKLGKYQLFERLGRGGMAEVYRAHHVNLDRFVAIKVLHAFLADDPEFKDRFENEARNIARLKHANIVQVYDFENDPETETYYMVMELIDGPTLKDLLAILSERAEVLSLNEALRIVREAAGALAYAHSQKMLHRDVKPANLMLDRDNRVVLTDFGIAKMVTGAQFTASGGMVGTPAYMAPEQGLGEAGDERSDLYSLGVILFQLLTGQLPYEAETPLAIILKHLNEPIPSVVALNPDLPPDIDVLIQRMMAKDPADRYQSAGALIADLDRFERGQPLGDAPQHESGDDTPIRTPIAPPRSAVHTPNTPIPAVVTQASPTRPRWRIPLWLWVIFGGIVGAGIFALLQGGGGLPLLAFLASPTPTATATFTPSQTATSTYTLTPTATLTFTLTPTETPTATLEPTETLLPTETLAPTITPSPRLSPTQTLTASNTRRPTITYTPSITPTPSITFTPTLDITLTLIQATLIADFQTATINACDFNYTIVKQEPEDATFVPTNRDYEREITLRNTGTCAWERNSALMFVSGENFNAGARIIITDRVDVDEEVVLLFRGRTPATGGRPLTGTWELRTSGNIRIGQPLTININVFEGGV